MKQQISQEFDQFASDYRKILDDVCSATGESSLYFAEVKAQKLAKWFPHLIDAPLHILDFGCGDGMMTWQVSKIFKNAKMYGVDPSPKSIEIAQKLYPSMTFGVNSDIHTAIDFEDAQFDLVLTAGVFHHIPYRMHDGYMSELTRILKKNGCLVMFELNPLNPGTVYIFNKSPFEDNAKMLKPWYTYKLTKKYGGCSIKYYSFFPRWMKWFRPLEKWIERVPCGGLYAAIVRKI